MSSLETLQTTLYECLRWNDPRGGLRGRGGGGLRWYDPGGGMGVGGIEFRRARILTDITHAD